jgi:hypothetical protein
MQSQPAQTTAESAIDYDFPPVAELELGDTQYRVDVGARSAIAVSGRTVGTWSWALQAEGSWDGVRLKAKGLDRLVVAALEKALRAAAEATA